MQFGILVSMKVFDDPPQTKNSNTNTEKYQNMHISWFVYVWQIRMVSEILFYADNIKNILIWLLFLKSHIK